jgi:hypothetical protein
MSPITQTVQGQSLTFLLTMASLNAVLTTDELNRAFSPQWNTMDEAMVSRHGPSGFTAAGLIMPTQTMWASMLAAGGSAQSSQIPPEQVRSILREALIGGGMASAAAIDTAEHIQRGQISRAVDFLTAQIVQAAVAAG